MGRKNNGFTLIELIVVVSVLSILSAMAVGLLNPVEQLRKARDTQRKYDLSQIQRGLEQYYQDNGGYPSYSTTSPNDYQIVGLSGRISWGASWSPYMSVLPKDPSSSKRYVYYSSTNRQSYYLYASLDRGGKDPQACSGGSQCTNVPANVKCGTATDICNYGVTSPNVSP